MSYTSEIQNHLPKMPNFGLGYSNQNQKSEIDEKFEQYTQFYKNLGDNLYVLVNHAKNAVVKRIESAQICFDLGFSIQQLKKLETTTKQHSTQTNGSIMIVKSDENLEPMLKKSQICFEQMRDKQSEQGFNLQEVFENSIQNMYRNILTVQEALIRRQTMLDNFISSQVNYQTALSKHSKNQQININEYHSNMIASQKKLQQISENLQREIEEFNKARQQEWLVILNDFKILQIKQANNLLEIWKND